MLGGFGVVCGLGVGLVLGVDFGGVGVVFDV